MEKVNELLIKKYHTCSGSYEPNTN